MGNNDMTSLNLSSFIFLLKRHTQNQQPPPSGKGVGKGSWIGCPTTLLKLPQNWVICIGVEMVAPTTLLKLPQYWMICVGNIVN